MNTEVQTPAEPANPSTMAAYPDPIVFFDGVCGLCSHSVDFLISRDRRHVLRFAPLQGETSRQLLNLPPDSDYSSMVLWEQGRMYRQSDAVARALIHAGGFWGFVGLLMRCVPRPLRNWGYNLVARNRYRWFGKKESCRLPQPAERALFLP